jgi:hypothetical protein
VSSTQLTLVIMSTYVKSRLDSDECDLQQIHQGCVIAIAARVDVIVVLLRGLTHFFKSETLEEPATYVMAGFSICARISLSIKYRLEPLDNKRGPHSL